MAAYKPRPAQRCSTAAAPDNRLIVASALLSVTVLVLMLCAAIGGA